MQRKEFNAKKINIKLEVLNIMKNGIPAQENVSRILVWHITHPSITSSL